MTPCHPARARKMLRTGRAAVFRRYPFTIILKEVRLDAVVRPVQIKIDPGSKVTGIALVKENMVVFAAELQHRGAAIRKALSDRRALRRGRRNRKTRYRAPRFDNRTRPAGWIAPSLQHRVDTTMTWVRRFMKLAPVAALSQELVKFDTQAMQNPEINGVEYQQGTLAGYELREYLLEKWGRKCAYCDAENVPLQIEHIESRTHGGSNRASNLTLACEPCNQKKNSSDVSVFLAHDPARLKRILAQAKAPLRDAAAVNATRWRLFEALKATGLPVETGSGGRTKYNRTRQEYPKGHWIDTACVGESGLNVELDPSLSPLQIAAKGHGRRQRCGPDKYGFPFRHAPREKRFLGFQTGDLVRADIPNGKFAGVHTGRVAIRFRPSFRLNGFDVHPKYLKIVQYADGYEYSLTERRSAVSSPAKCI